MKLLIDAIKAVGQTRIASECGVSKQAVHQWIKKGLPRTEWTGETNYSAVIARLSGGRYTAEQLLEDARRTSAASRDAA